MREYLRFLLIANIRGQTEGRACCRDAPFVRSLTRPSPKQQRSLASRTEIGVERLPKLLAPDVEVRHFLSSADAGGMPHTQPVVRETASDSACDARHDVHRGDYDTGLGDANIKDMCPGNDEDMARMKLPEIQNGDRVVILGDDRGGSTVREDLAERAQRMLSIDHSRSHVAT